MGKPTRKWWRMAEMYQRFALQMVENGVPARFDETSAQEMFDYESTGARRMRDDNGFAIGKAMMDITLEMWLKDLRGELLFYFELAPEYPEWFLHRVIPAPLRMNKRV